MKKVLLFMAVLFFASFAAAAFADEGPLQFPMGEAFNPEAHGHNEEGLAHYAKGHYDVALKHFQTASKIDPSVGESHFNVALAMHKMKMHGAATDHFYAARMNAKGNENITGSTLLNEHAPMKTDASPMKEGS